MNIKTSSLRPFVPALLLAICALACASPGGDTRITATQPASVTTVTTSPAVNTTSEAAQANSPDRLRTVAAGNGNQASEILFDYRQEQPYNAPQVRPEREEEIFQALRGERLNGDNATFKSSFVGSFTAPNTKQELFLISRHAPDGESRSAVSDKSLLAIFEGKRLVLNVDAGDADMVLRASDVDGDGVDEFLLESSTLERGATISSLRLVELEDNRLRVVEDFGKVFRDTCGSTTDAPEIIAGVIRRAGADEAKASGQQAAKFKVDFYRSHCPNVGNSNKGVEFQFAPDARIR